MINRFWLHWTKTLPAILLLVMPVLLTGCFGNDEDWHGKNISGLMPELEFDLINSQGDPVSGSDYSGRVRMLFSGLPRAPMFARRPCENSIRQPVAWTRSFRKKYSLCS